MVTIKRLRIPRKKITEFCNQWNISEFAIFGSAIQDDFHLDSDVDVLVTFSATSNPTLFDMARMQDELEQIFGHEADLVSKRGISASKNYLRRDAILESAQVIYAT